MDEYRKAKFDDGSEMLVHISGRTCWNIKIDRYHPIINMFKKTECMDCGGINTCPYSLDEYNVYECLGYK